MIIERIVVSSWDNHYCQEEVNRICNGDLNSYYIYNHGVIYFKCQLYIPNENNLKKEVLEWEYNSKIAGHIDQDKILEIIYKNLFWPQIKEAINNYMISCHMYQRIKHPRQARYGLLHLLELVYSL
jgi:hypothetical protein